MLTASQDFVGAEIQGGRVILLSEPRGCGGGMGSGWTKLKHLCKDKAKNKEEANDLFNAAQLHFFKMGEDCTPYNIGDRTIISADEFRRITVDAYQEPLRLAREVLLDIANIDYVVLSGGACASNFFIREKWTACIEDWRRELEQQGRESEAGFGVIIADAEDAEYVTVSHPLRFHSNRDTVMRGPRARHCSTTKIQWRNSKSLASASLSKVTTTVQARRRGLRSVSNRSEDFSRSRTLDPVISKPSTSE